MFSISSELMARLGQAVDDRFVRSLLPHIQASHFVLVRSATAAGLESALRFGVARARGYGLTQEADLRHFLDLMLSLGSEFDTDPQYAWLRPFLRGMEGVPVIERVRLLRWHTRLYFDRTLGKDGGVSALERFGQMNRAALETVAGDLPRLAPRLAMQLHPERMDYMVPEALASLLRRAQSNGAAFGVEAPVAAALFFSLMFRFGHEAANDPLYPWIAQGVREGNVDLLLNRATAFALALAREIREVKK